MSKLFKINFTKKCILMSVISQEKNITLINSFNNIPIVKLYTANSYDENFIYSKIKGALCLFINKDETKNLFYLKIYDIRNYSIVFNIEIKKEYLKYFLQYNDDFYFLQLRESLIGFKFNSMKEGKNFYNILKVEPNPEIIEQNEKSKNIKQKEIIKIINKVNEAIKLKLKEKFLAGKKEGGGWFSKKEENNFPNIKINDRKGEYLDLSNIPKIYFFLKNVEINDILCKMIIFQEHKFPKIEYQNFVLKFDNCFNLKSKTAPMIIIEKDFLNILSKKNYIEILVNNMINDMKMRERLDIFKKEYIKRNKKKAGYKLALKKGIRAYNSKKTKDMSSRHLSRVSSDSSILDGYHSETNDNMRSSISSNSGLSGLYNNDNRPKVSKKDKYSVDKKSINEITSASLENIMDSDDDSNEAGFKYFNEDKKTINSQNQKILPTQKTLKQSISSDYILGQKDKSKKGKKKAEDLMNFLGGDSVAIPEIEEDEENRNSGIYRDSNSKQIKNNIFVNKNYKNKINLSSKTSLTGFLMTTNKLGKNKK